MCLRDTAIHCGTRCGGQPHPSATKLLLNEVRWSQTPGTQREKDAYVRVRERAHVRQEQVSDCLRGGGRGVLASSPPEGSFENGFESFIQLFLSFFFLSFFLSLVQTKVRASSPGRGAPD